MLSSENHNYSNPTLPLLFYVHTYTHYNKQKGTNLAAPKVKKQAPWQSESCFEACFALILTHFALKMLKTHLCPGRQKCVTAWWRVADCGSRRSLHKFALTKSQIWTLTYRTAASLRAHSPPSKKTAQRRSFCLVESGGLEPSTFRV